MINETKIMGSIVAQNIFFIRQIKFLYQAPGSAL